MLEIEIVESNIIEGGVEVFARAWNENGQIGFGKDGTVDIERFRIINPPVLVLDPTGDIQIETVSRDIDGTETVKIKRLREDPEEAILQSLEQTIGLMKNKSDGENIVANKRGNTTSTFYAGSGDGGILGYVSSATPSSGEWDTLHDATTLAEAGLAGLVSTTNSGDVYAVRAFRQSGAAGIQIGRSFFPIDTSSLPDSDTIDGATFSVYGNSFASASLEMGLVETSQASTSSLSLTDFDQCGAINSATEGATRVTANSATDQYWDWTLNATGLSWINKTGTTKLGLRSAEDLDDAYPASDQDKRFNTDYSESGGTSTDPKLVVEHSAGGATANLSARRQHLMMM